MTEDHSEAHVSFETLDFQAVARVATRASLRDVRLGWSELLCSVDEPRGIDPKWPEAAFTGFDSHSHRDEDDVKTFWVSCSFICLFRPDETRPDGDATDDDEAPAISIQAIFVLRYDLAGDGDVEDSDLEHFAFANGTHNAWPYWRELAHSATMRLGVPPYIAPPFKLPSVHDPGRKSEPAAE